MSALSYEDTFSHAIWLRYWGEVKVSFSKTADLQVPHVKSIGVLGTADARCITLRDNASKWRGFRCL
jgi:hypothetical protein